MMMAADDADLEVRCWRCPNDDPRFFVADEAEGDLICRKCGAVVRAHRTFDGNWERSFEGEEKSQQGPAMRSLMSSSYSLRTTFGAALGVTEAELARLHRTMARIERAGDAGAVRTSQRTTIAYKDRMKSLVRISDAIPRSKMRAH